MRKLSLVVGLACIVIPAVGNAATCNGYAPVSAKLTANSLTESVLTAHPARAGGRVPEACSGTPPASLAVTINHATRQSSGTLNVGGSTYSVTAENAGTSYFEETTINGERFLSFDGRTDFAIYTFSTNLVAGSGYGTFDSGFRFSAFGIPYDFVSNYGFTETKAAGLGPYFDSYKESETIAWADDVPGPPGEAFISFSPAMIAPIPIGPTAPLAISALGLLGLTRFRGRSKSSD